MKESEIILNCEGIRRKLIFSKKTNTTTFFQQIRCLFPEFFLVTPYHQIVSLLDHSLQKYHQVNEETISKMSGEYYIITIKESIWVREKEKLNTFHRTLTMKFNVMVVRINHSLELDFTVNSVNTLICVIIVIIKK
jgi:hypothetical protein